MSEGDDKSNGKVSEIIPPGQAIESSRRLDTHLTRSIEDLKRGSLSAKVTSLSIQMDSFNVETHRSLDAVAERIRLARAKRDEAVEVHMRHYDGLIDDFEQSIDAVEQLSNLPLDRGGKT
jgi:hypothetical protein